MKNLLPIITLSLISFSNGAFSETKGLECTIPNDPWKAVRTITFDMSKEYAEWDVIKYFYKGRSKGRPTVSIHMAKVSESPNSLIFTVDANNEMIVSRSTLTFVLRHWDMQAKVSSGTCKLIEIEDPDNIL